MNRQTSKADGMIGIMIQMRLSILTPRPISTIALPSRSYPEPIDSQRREPWKGEIVVCPVDEQEGGIICQLSCRVTMKRRMVMAMAC